MTVKAIIWNTDAIYGDEAERNALNAASADFAAARFNQVALSDRSATAMKTALKDSGLDRRLVHTLDGDEAAARTGARSGMAAFTEALGGLNQRRAMAKAELVKPEEVVVITDTHENAIEASRVGMQAIRVGGSVKDSAIASFIVNVLANRTPRP